jgi:hypothetical protein
VSTVNLEKSLCGIRIMLVCVYTCCLVILLSSNLCLVQKGKKSVHRIMENGLIRIPKLKGIENWAVWKFQTRVILQSSDAWSIVDGSSAIPVQGQTIDETTFNRTLAAWKKNDSIAQRIIATTVEEKPLLHILNCKSAKDMWDKLIQVYEQKSETSIHMLMQQWYNHGFMV